MGFPSIVAILHYAQLRVLGHKQRVLSNSTSTSYAQDSALFRHKQHRPTRRIARYFVTSNIVLRAGLLFSRASCAQQLNIDLRAGLSQTPLSCTLSSHFFCQFGHRRNVDLDGRNATILTRENGSKSERNSNDRGRSRAV